MEYVGSDLTAFEAEYLRVENIAGKLSQIEPQLYQSKWWDYRTLHPMQATYLFAEYYRRSVLQALRRRIDIYRVKNYWGMKKRDFLDLSKGSVTGMWKARQAADLHGIPYDVWCEGAMMYAEKSLWRFVPAPHNLYSTKLKEENKHFMVSMVDFIKARWEKIEANQFLVARHDFYKVENYCGHKDQKGHFTFMKRQLLRLGNKAIVIAELMSERRVMTEVHVRLIFKDRAEAILADAQNFISNGEDL